MTERFYTGTLNADTYDTGVGRGGMGVDSDVPFYLALARGTGQRVDSMGEPMAGRAGILVPGAIAVPDDDAGLAAAARLDPAAFIAIYERYRVPVYRYLRALGADDGAALDLMSTTFERALRSIGGYRSSGTLRAWLFRIARNAHRDEHRRTSRLTDLSQAASSTARAADVEQGVELRLLLRALPAATRDALALRYAGGLTTNEIAPILGKRPGAVQKLIERGLDTLREAMEADA